MSLFDDAPAPGSSSAGGQQQQSSSASSAPASPSASSYSIPAQAPSQAQDPVRVAGNDYQPPPGGVGDVEREKSDHDRTISMTVFFLVLGVLYIGFCAYYRRRNKARRVMGDNAEGGGGGAANMEGSRRRQRLENQASALSFSLTTCVCVCVYRVVSLSRPQLTRPSLHPSSLFRTSGQVVLDESSDAAARARTNSDMLAKLKKRMSSIKRALNVRTIVDDDDDEGEGGGGGGGGGGEGDAVLFLGAGGGDEDDGACGVARGSLAAAHGIGAARGEDDAATDAPPAPASAAFVGRSIITIEEEEDDDDDDDDEGGGGCRDTPRGHPTRDTAEGGAGGPTTTSSTSRPRSSSTSSDSSPRASPTTSRTASPRDPPRPSLSSPRRYTDALSCGGLRRPHYAEALSCASASSPRGNTGSPAAIGGAGRGAAGRSRSSSLSSSPDAGGRGGISLSAIVSACGEECNICLSQFQVGDHAAWSSRRRGGGIGPGGGAAVVCGHVFHEECITRWLLVRDRCPICRESYFPTEDAPTAAGAIVAADVPAAADRAGGGRDGPDLERGENNGDDGVSDVEIRSTPLVRRMIERFGPAT